MSQGPPPEALLFFLLGPMAVIIPMGAVLLLYYLYRLVREFLVFPSAAWDAFYHWHIGDLDGGNESQ